jgi:hypothetical protein
MKFLDWVDKSKELLISLSGDDGIHASLQEEEANYGAVFTRDAVMAGIAGLLISDDRITNSFIFTLQNLKKFQGKQGQIASNYTILGNEEPRISYGTLSPKIDSLTWYIIGVSICLAEGHLVRDEWHDSITKAAHCLDALEYNNRNLIYVPQGGNWADEYVIEGYTLYDQVLRVWALKLASNAFNEPSWKTKSEAIKQSILVNYGSGHESGSEIYHKRLFAKQQKDEHPYLYASFTPSAYNFTFDLAAHALLGFILPLGSPVLSRSHQWINDTFLEKGLLPPAFYPTINEGDKAWDELSNFYLYSFKNKPNHYHNGGIWPIWLGWLGLSLSMQGENILLDKLKVLLTTQLDHFQFDEYLNGKTMEAGGTKNMAYSATGILFLSQSGTIKKLNKIFNRS